MGGYSVLKAIPGHEQFNLQHLRRFSKAAHMPSHLRTHLPLQSSTSSSELSTDAPHQQQDTSQSTAALDSEFGIETTYVLLAPTSLLPLAVLLNLLTPLFPSTAPPHIRKTSVPLHAPTSPAQAAAYSAIHWPTTFTNTNPFGPHPSLVARAAEELEAGKWMWLATQVALETSTGAREDGSASARHGVGVGAVVVERRKDAHGRGVGEGRCVVVAGDARWSGRGGARARGRGDPARHAVMRAIGMVARKRRMGAGGGGGSAASSSGIAPPPGSLLGGGADVGTGRPVAAIDRDCPTLPLERAVFSNPCDAADEYNLQPNGYLCLDLEIYVTHEPCVMCSMALVHSRFGKAVFGRRMAETGGLCAEREVMRGEHGERHGDEGEGDEDKGEKDGDKGGKYGDIHIGGDVVERINAAGLGYGLFWREDLNWRFLAWEWKADDSDNGGGMPEVPHDVHV